jgi:hypothetical protein
MIDFIFFSGLLHISYEHFSLSQQQLLLRVVPGIQVSYKSTVSAISLLFDLDELTENAGDDGKASFPED